MTDTPRLIEHAFPAEAGVAGLGPREERAAWAYLDAAHLAGAAAAGGVPGGADRHAAARSRNAGGAQGAVREDRRQGGQEDRDARRCPTARPSSARRKRPRAASCTGAGRRRTRTTLDWFRQEIRKAYGGRAPKVLDPVRRRRGDPAGGHAPGLRGDGRGHQPGRLVHPQMHAGIPAEAGRERRARCRISSSKTRSSWRPSTRPIRTWSAGPRRPKKQADEERRPGFFRWSRRTPAARRRPTSPGTSGPGASGCSTAPGGNLARFYPTYADFEPLDQE